MTKFIYLFRNNPGAYRSMSPEQMQQTTQRWMEWKTSLETTGQLVQFGERLDGSGKVVRGQSKTVTDGPYVEVKDFIQGYLVVQAADLEQAAELAKGCPVLDSGGSVEVRPLPPM
ncbi:MAG: hypothetical protein JWN02_396 [Acidobacteria bacterium]|nr:hypothetical protein [Acidobacteriota bacterium]